MIIIWLLYIIIIICFNIISFELTHSLYVLAVDNHLSNTFSLQISNEAMNLAKFSSPYSPIASTDGGFVIIGVWDVVDRVGAGGLGILLKSTSLNDIESVVCC